jgi:hypothetical protein
VIQGACCVPEWLPDDTASTQALNTKKIWTAADPLSRLPTNRLEETSEGLPARRRGKSRMLQTCAMTTIADAKPRNEVNASMFLRPFPARTGTLA